MADAQIQKTQDSNNPSNFQHIANNNQFNKYWQKNYLEGIPIYIFSESCQHHQQNVLKTRNQQTNQQRTQQEAATTSSPSL